MNTCSKNLTIAVDSYSNFLLNSKGRLRLLAEILKFLAWASPSFPVINKAMENLFPRSSTIVLTYSHPDGKPKPRQVIKLHDKKYIDEYREQWYGWNTGHFKWQGRLVLGLTHKEHYKRYQENP